MSNKPTHTNPQILAFLKEHPMGVLSTVDSGGKPWGSAIYYVADENLNIYFVTRADTFKYQNLDKTPFAALTIADHDSQTTVQLSGEISQVPVQEYMDIIFDKLAKIRPTDDHNWAPPLTKIHEGNYMPLRLTPSKLQFADYKHLKADPHADYIEHVI